MSGTLVPYVNGSPEEYAQALDRLHETACAVRAPGRTSWAPTLAWCTALTLGLVLVLPRLPATVTGDERAAVAALAPAAAAVPQPAAFGTAVVPSVRPVAVPPARQAGLAGRKHRA